MRETSTTVQAYSQEITHRNYIVQDHRVHGVHILPGVALLDMIYRLSLPYLGTQTIELKKILFKQPIATSTGFDQKVYVTFTPQFSYWQVTIRSQRVQNGVLLEPGYDENLECLLYTRNSDKKAPEFDIQGFIAHSQNTWEMEEIYRLARNHDIEHGIFMKSLGHVYQHGNEELMALHLSELAEKYRNKFFAHPAFLDGSTFAGSSFRLSEQADALSTDATPYIPLMMDRFCIYKPLPSTIYTYSKKSGSLNEVEETLPDLVSTNIRVFSESGEVLADFEKVTTKRIREPHLIKGLVERKIDMEPIHDVPPTIQAIPEQYVGGDKSLTLYLQHEIGRRLKKTAADIDIQTGFYELGLDSTQLLELVKNLESIVGDALYPTLLFEYTTIARLAAYLEERYEVPLDVISQQIPRMKESSGPIHQADEEKIIYFEPVWAEKELPPKQKSTNSQCDRVIILFNLPEKIRVSFCDHIQGAEVMTLSPGIGEIPHQMLTQCQQLLTVIQHNLNVEGSKKVLIQVVGDGRDELATYMSTLAGMLKTAFLENPKIASQLIRISSIYSHSIEHLSKALEDEAIIHKEGVIEVWYKDRPLQRYVKTLREVTFRLESPISPYKEQGVYVITGGLGGLGRKVANHIARQSHIKLALLGRSKLDREGKAEIDQLIKQGADVVYLQTDISQQASLSKAIDRVRNKWGNITGVIHCAGVIKDQFIIKKNGADFIEVFGPKVSGVWNLDELTRGEDLDFFVLFSSVAAVMGNIGQCDYASANAFMDSFSLCRDDRVRRGKCFGKTITVNWPLWERGGMQVDAQWEEMMQNTYGMKLLPVPLGLKILDRLMGEDPAQSVVMYGDEAKIRDYLGTSLTLKPKSFNNKVTLSAAVTPGDEKRAQDKVLHQVSRPRDIAVIGLSGRYPQANNVEVFYQNLKAGMDCIGTIPRKRWKGYSFSYDVEEFYRYGGFLEGVDQFDPMFFNIVPRQAAQMDPQARLFLEIAWEACENAGFYQDRTTHRYRSSSDKSVGVFVGVFWSHYELFGAEMTQKGVPISFGNSPAGIANMVSYYLNFHGPSIAVDTMCSSALTSIHLACESLRRRECHYALAGGVNLVTHPHKYLFLKQAGFLSSDGKSRSFGRGGDGYVPGEGVGAVLLTSVDEAEKEGYSIYGVVKGTALNHVGKTSGPTVPDPIAQSEVISDALKDAAIDPRTISYVEAHGTGTSLGDPIEIVGLSKTFGKYSQDKQFCALGSVKSNIGHCESAAGIAGLTKVLLQLKHRELVPSLHSKTLNPNIDFSTTPFTVQQELTEWKRPVIEIEGKLREYPRRAGISSFGAGGANAHLIIEEYLNEKLPLRCSAMRQSPSRSARLETRNSKFEMDGPYLIVLSAKNEERLKELVRNLHTYLTSPVAPRPLPLHNMAYTLQVGREAMEERLAFTVRSAKELEEKLKAFVEDRDDAKMLHRGRVKRDLDTLAIFAADEDMERTVTAWIDKRKFSKLLDLWVKGLNVDWQKLYNVYRPRRVSLPVYPFAKERYWISEDGAQKIENGIVGGSAQHQLQRKITSDLLDQEADATPKERNKQTGTGGRYVNDDDTFNTLLTIVSEVTKLPVNRIDADADFESLGLDSIMITELNKKLEAWTGKADSTLFFKYKTLSLLAEFLSSRQLEAIGSSGPSNSGSTDRNPKKLLATLPSIKQQQAKISQFNTPEPADQDIAIIGMSGRYPKANKLTEFWRSLHDGQDCITEIPKERFDYRPHFSAEKGRKDTIYCKWGGFIDDIDKIDALFFNLSPQDARTMDPQGRIFLESCWACLETAGYISPYWQKESRNIGVFAGVTFNNYQLLMAEEAGQTPFFPASSQTFSIANRVSYFFNFTGPSLTLDTACSSSLYAIHQACESLKRGECNLALAGGANLSLHPSKYLTLCLTRFASSDGHCHAFAANGDGYVPSEGVGVVLLKSCQQARADRDPILAIIKGTGVSHDGKTQGFMVPNPVSQSKAIEAAFQQANISPESISYVEAHGTGTALGDPIEIQGLMDVYSKYTNRKQFCAIGSVKSNIGHGEAAAGIAQLTKTVLQMQHKMLVPSLLHGPLNSNIDFKNSAFYVQEQKTPWKPLEQDGKLLPRRAGISSFGAGGVNVHIIVEEAPEPLKLESTPTRESPSVIPLSAHLASQLPELVRNLHSYCRDDAAKQDRLMDIAFTLQTKRATLRYRLAFVVRDKLDLLQQLEHYLKQDQNNNAGKKYYEADAHSDQHAFVLKDSPEDQDYLKALLKRGKMERLAQLWVMGSHIPWEVAYIDRMPCRFLPLPNYAFLRKRYWITEAFIPNETKAKTGMDTNKNEQGRPGQSTHDQTRLLGVHKNGPTSTTLDITDPVPPSNKEEKPAIPTHPTALEKFIHLSDLDREDSLKTFVSEKIKSTLGFNSEDRIDPKMGFFELGMESTQAVEILQFLRDQLEPTLPDTILFDYPTLDALVQHILELIPWNQLSEESAAPSAPPPKIAEYLDKETIESELVELFDNENGNGILDNIAADVDGLSEEELVLELTKELEWVT